MNGHRHKLESESVGPTAANDVANRLAALLDHEPDPSAHIVSGRFLLPDGATSRWPTGAVGVLLASGRVIGDPRVERFGGRGVNATAWFMDYDGQPQRSPEVATRGMVMLDRSGCVVTRYYLDVFPAMSGQLGSVRYHRPPTPPPLCPALVERGVPEVQPGAAAAAGFHAAGATPRPNRGRRPSFTG